MGKAEAGTFEVLPGGKEIGQGGPHDVGSKAWAKKVRDRAKQLSSDLDTGYMELSEILYTVYDVPLKGDKSQKALFQSWGYGTFAEYAEKELNLNKRKAERLRRIWYVLHVQLSGLPDDVKQRIVNLGWSKASIVVRAMTIRNAKKWVTIAEQSSYTDLDASITAYVAQKENSSIQHAQTGGKPPPDPEPTIGSLPLSSFDKPYAKALPGPQAVSEDTYEPPETQEATDADDDNVVAPQPEKMFLKNFCLFPDQADIVNQALERSAELSESKKPGHNLTLICTEFLATNDFTTASRAQQLKFLSNLEKSMGLKLIVLDQEDDLLYGIKSLQSLIAKAKEEAGTAEADGDETDGQEPGESAWDPEPVVDEEDA